MVGVAVGQPVARVFREVRVSSEVRAWNPVSLVSSGSESVDMRKAVAFLKVLVAG
ncbi:MAG: hypothetical protein CM1200mP26_18440 [Acidimicrobiales bacterium]|nr:MAG: hypothetical protein CM1200mP26_18440 [Acidimicrobiales bacterium]